MTDSSNTTPKPTARRLSIDYLLNPAAKTLDSKGCVINNKGGGLRPPMRPKHWDKKGATYPPPSWSSPQISPLRRNSVGVVQGDSGGRAGGISLPGIDSLSPFPGRRPTQGSDAGATAPATPLSSPVLHRRTNNGSSEELPFIDVSSLENFCGQQPESSAFEQRSEYQRRAGVVPSSSSSHSIYSPLSSPYPSPCPSPSYSFSSPSSTPMHSSPSSSPIPFLQRSLSPTFGGLFSDDSSSSSSQLSDSGGESDTPAFKSASSFHARISSPSITIARASETPSSTLRPNLVSGSAFQSISHSAFSPVSSRRKDSSKATAPPSLAPEKSPATKKRLNEEMQASNLSSAFANWSISSSDEREDSNSGMEDNGPHAHSPPITRRNKKMREESPSSSPSIELGPASPLPSPSSSPFLSSAPNGCRARAAASKARGRREKPKPEKDTDSEEEEEEEDDKDDSKRKRATPEQVHILEQVFDMNPLPTAATKKELAKRIGMSHRQIQVWFQNKRARMKRMGQVPKCKDPFVFHHLAVCDDGEFSLKAEGHLPEEVENLLPAHSSKRK